MTDLLKATQPERDRDERSNTLPQLELVEGDAPRKERRQRKRTDNPTKDRMNDDVVAFVQTLAAKYPDRFQRRAKQAKARVVTLLKLHMRPFPKRSGRPKDPRITEALRLKRQQEREIRAGGRRRPDWIAIARACAPGFERIKCNWHRSRAIERLQNAVKQREARERKRKDHTRARKGQYSARRPRE